MARLSQIKTGLDTKENHDAANGRASMPEKENEKQRVWYACQRCTNCCRWPGFVRLTDDDISRISAFLGISEEALINSHTRLHADRKGLALLDKADGACAMLDGRDCTIQPVKPKQCQGFPNKWNFPGWRQVCEAKETLL